MDINEFIEQDILIFLDDKLDIPRPDRAAQQVSTLYLTRDYEKEITAALSHNDITTAKQTLHALKDEFDTCPNGTPDKEQLKLMLTTLYEKIKDHLDEHHIPAASAFQNAPEPPAPHKVETQQPDDALLRSLVSQVEEHLRQNHLKEAIDAYRRAKQEAIRLPTVSTDLTRRLLSLYATIKNDLGKPVREMDQHLMLQLEQEKHTLDQCLHAGNISAATQQYRKMRLLAQQLQNKEQAHVAAEKLRRIHSILEVLVKTYNEQHLGRALP